MLILAYCAMKDESVQNKLGEAEYSYYFVYRQFIKALSKVYFVVPVEGELGLLDHYYNNCFARGETCFCLFFSQPHKIPQHIVCPIIPIFAWEFDTLPRDINGDMEMDWGWRLAKHGWTITHSNYSVACVKNRIRDDFPVISIPSPVWDTYQGLHKNQGGVSDVTFLLKYQGSLIDSATLNFDAFSPETLKSSLKTSMDAILKNQDISVSIKGIVYLSVFNPYDKRKNWEDLLRAFGWIFKQTKDATLVLKVVHQEADQIFHLFIRELYKLSPMSCRVLIIHGYLEEKDYSALIKHSDFVVNSSHGEGQCLPLMEGMSAGKPAISPDHTAMGDYIHPENAFIVASSIEPATFPHDPRAHFRALKYRIDWKSLCTAFRLSYQMKKKRPDAYRKMSMQAHSTMKSHCSEATALRQIRPFLESKRREHIAFDSNWNSRPYQLKMRLRWAIRHLKRRIQRAYKGT